MKKSSFLVIAMLILLSACSKNSVSLEGEWKLVSYGDATNPTPAILELETSFNFGAEGQFGGQVGCNSFGGDYKVSGNEITFSNIFYTHMFCEGIMDQETSVLNIITYNILTAEFNGNQLKLTSADGTSVIVLERK